MEFLQPWVLQPRFVQLWVLTTRGLTTSDSYNGPGGLTTRSLITRGSYNQGSYNRGFLKLGVVKLQGFDWEKGK